MPFRRTPPTPPHTHQRPLLTTASPRAAPQICKANYKEHQQKQCTPAFVEKLKCGVKLMRAVDYLCRPEFSAFTACMQGAAGDKSKCLAQATSFDMCTESW